MEYEHSILNVDTIQLDILAHVIIQGVMRPKEFERQHQTIPLLPKRKIPPPFERRRAAEGWGVRVTMGFSVRKFARWLAVCMFASILFAVVWLTCIDKTELQNAFIPFTLFLTFLSILLVMMQSSVQ